MNHLLDKHVPNCISGIHCVWENVDVNFVSVSKRDFIANFPGEKVAFLDDSAHEVLGVRDIIPSYLYDRFGSFDHVNEIRHRVRSWKEFGEIFLRDK